MKKSIFIAILALCCSYSFAQVNIKGNVYEDEFRTPMPDVSVFTSSGNKTYTDSLGRFNIPVAGKKDSIYFMYKTRQTKVFPVDTIKNPDNFEIAIHLNILARKNTPPGYLPDIIVYSKDYRWDSIQNRRDYAAIFNYQKPGLSDVAQVPKIGNIPIPVGVYLDVNAIAESFQFRKNKRKEKYRDFALWLEQEKYIDHRFNKKAVSQITGLAEGELDAFIRKYRPDFIHLISMNDVDLGVYIKKCFQQQNQDNRTPGFKERIRRGIFLQED